jgi:hypothetical protein
MQGLAIFLHALRMVFGNFTRTLRIGGVALAVLVALTLSLGGLSRAEVTSVSGTAMVLTFARIIVGLWVAVAWHRYILLEEEPGALLPAWNGVAIWAYFKAGFLVGLILLVILLPLMTVAGFLLLPMAGPSAASPPLLLGLIGFLVAFLPAIFIFYRLSPALPAAAIGRPLGLREAWFQTGVSGWAFVPLTLVSVLAGWLLDLPLPALARVSLPLALVWSAVGQWLMLMVGASIMTTIYGHYIERRDLNA